MTKLSTIFIVVIVIAVAVAGLWFSGRLTGDNTNPGDSSVMSDPKNVTLTLDDMTVTLVNGVSVVEGTERATDITTTEYFGNEAKGDLNGDGVADIAFLVSQNTGGTGTFYYVAVLLSTSGAWPTDAAFLGDRIHPQTTEIRDATLVVNYADYAPGESFADNPSMGVSKYFTIQNGKLIERID